MKSRPWRGYPRADFRPQCSTVNWHEKDGFLNPHTEISRDYLPSIYLGERTQAQAIARLRQPSGRQLYCEMRISAKTKTGTEQCNWTVSARPICLLSFGLFVV